MPDSNFIYQQSILRTVPGSTSLYSLYTWKAGDRPDLVAYETLGNSQLWWAIFDINPEIIYPLNVEPGTIVRIPSQVVMGQGTLTQ